MVWKNVSKFLKCLFSVQNSYNDTTNLFNSNLPAYSFKV